LSAILVEDRLRSVDPERAAQIALSFRETGQITPVEVAPEDARGLHRLIAGAHRVEAARLAGMVAVQAVVFEGSNDAQRMREIDENLYRRELSDLDRSAFLAERLTLHERMFGEIKRGRKRKSEIASQLDFYADVAERFGLSRRLAGHSRAVHNLAHQSDHEVTAGAGEQLERWRRGAHILVGDRAGRLWHRREVSGEQHRQQRTPDRPAVRLDDTGSRHALHAVDLVPAARIGHEALSVRIVEQLGLRFVRATAVR
jgi:ParB family chromosome partitioning protein